ncbi:MAG: hypothetical protein ABH846_04220 [Patescibacteria group bacterium]
MSNSNQGQIEKLEAVASQFMKQGDHKRASLIHSAINLLDQAEDLSSQIGKIESGVNGLFAQLFGSSNAVKKLKDEGSELINQAHDLLDKAGV